MYHCAEKTYRRTFAGVVDLWRKVAVLRWQRALNESMV